VKVGDLVLWKPDGDLGIVVEIDTVGGIKVFFQKTGWAWIYNNSGAYPGTDALELLSESR
tara:strand:- start:1 stop:180 length:180 start_codon:yes stop_codon:yes gene_type:complete